MKESYRSIIINHQYQVGIKFLTVQTEGQLLQFSIPLCMPPGQKKSGISGYINQHKREELLNGKSSKPKEKAKTL